MGYSRRLSTYLEIITLSDQTHMMSMTNPMTNSTTINLETLRIDSGHFLEESIKLIRMNLSMVLYITVKQVDSCYNCVCSHLT